MNPFEEILNNPNINLERLMKDCNTLHMVKFPEPKIIRVRKFATELTKAYEGSLWGSKRWIRKWGVEIYDPAQEQKYKETFRQSSYGTGVETNHVFEFEITSSKIFENKWEMKKFLLTMPNSPFIEHYLNYYNKKRKNK